MNTKNFVYAAKLNDKKRNFHIEESPSFYRLRNP
jgi:hypothetical protein